MRVQFQDLHAFKPLFFLDQVDSALGPVVQFILIHVLTFSILTIIQTPHFIKLVENFWVGEGHVIYLTLSHRWRNLPDVTGSSDTLETSLYYLPKACSSIPEC